MIQLFTYNNIFNKNIFEIKFEIELVEQIQSNFKFEVKFKLVHFLYRKQNFISYKKLYINLILTCNVFLEMQIMKISG